MTDGIHADPGFSLGTGWHDLERDDAGEPFRWTRRRASLKLDAPPGRVTFLHLHAGCPPFRGERRLDLAVGDHIVTTPLGPGWRDYVLALPTALGGATELGLSVDPAVEAAGDQRELGVMIRAIGGFRQRPHPLWLEQQVWRRGLARMQAWFRRPGAPRIVWVASFPRSGNTWLRFLLANLFFGPVERSRSVGLCIPEVIDPPRFKQSPQSPVVRAWGDTDVVFLKTHFPFRTDMPLLEHTAATLYVFRNPLDVALSEARFLRGLEGADDSERLDRFLTYGSTRRHIFRGFGSWQGHLQSWLDVAPELSPFPVLPIRYEDLLSDTRRVIAAIPEFLGVRVADEVIDAAIAASSLDAMKSLEREEIEAGDSGLFYQEERRAEFAAGWRFLGRGQSGAYADALSPEQIDLGLRTFGAIMRRWNMGLPVGGRNGLRG